MSRRKTDSGSNARYRTIFRLDTRSVSIANRVRRDPALPGSTRANHAEGIMQVISPLPPLVVAAAALGALFLPFAAGSVPADTPNVAVAERQVGAGVPICHGPASAGISGVMLRLAQTHTEVPQAEMQAASPGAAFAGTDPPLWDGLGGVTYKVTTANELAQSYFDQGLRLTYAFNHSEAQRAFRKAQKLDPDCAMCFWGEALVLGPNINLPMQEDAVAPA